VPAPSSAGSALNNKKYLVDDINDPTPCTLLYVKGRTLRTIKLVDAIVMATRIMHGQSILSECAVVKVTTIREGCEFEDLDYLDEEEEIEKLKDAKGNFILWPRKYIIIKNRSSMIDSPQSREDESTPTSQNTIHNTAAFTPHLKILQKLTLLPKFHHIHNLLSIILWNLLTLSLLFKIYQLNKLLSNVLLHIFILKNLLKLPLLFRINQLNKLLSSVLLHMFVLRNLLTLHLVFRINQLNKLLSSVLLHMLVLQSLLLTLPLLFKFYKMLWRSMMPLWMKPAKILILWWS
jgi:hypothetical protein